MIDVWTIALGIFYSEILKVTAILLIATLIFVIGLGAMSLEDRLHRRREAKAKLAVAEANEARIKSLTDKWK